MGVGTNLHSAGATPSLASAQQLGFDVKWRETHDRHRQYQTIEMASGDLVGDGVADDNYLHGFQTIDAALVWLTGEGDWDTALAAAGGLSESGTDSSPLLDVDGNIIGINAQFTFGNELQRV